MRERRESARKREDENRSAPGTGIGSEPDAQAPKQNGLEDDGFVFWPTSLGDPAGPRLVQVGPRAPREPEKARPPRRRRTTTAVFTVLFFAGAALTAAAGNEVATIVSSSPEAAAVETTTDTTGTDTTTTTDSTTTTDATETSTTTDAVGTTTSSTEPDSSAPAPAADETTTTATTTAAPEVDQPASGATTTPQATTPADPSAPAVAAPASEPASSASPDTTPSAPATAKTTQPEAPPEQLLPPQPASKSSAHKRAKAAPASYASLHKVPKPSDVEPEGDSSALTGDVHWIDQPLPDPTPASLRLSPEFARQLRAASSAEGLDWAFLLAVLRSERLNSSGEVSQTVLQQKAGVLGPLHVRADDQAAVSAYSSDPQFDRRVLVLEHYYKALGLEALVKGLADSKDSLSAKVLADPRIEIYPGGREDISAGRVDVRVVAMIAFLAESFGDVRVSCLISGHRLYARPGVISAHIYGRGLDIGALDGVSILGHQQPESVTARAVKQILLLPAEMLPRQVISLLGFGGPSFPLADHYNHIHIGY